ncbi:hypothetical protein V6N13_106224 [Hibiscus sabdariffa]
MATGCSKTVKLSIIAVLFSLIYPFSDAISFNFTSFTTDNHNISYENASTDNQFIQLTANQRDRRMTASIGRATYHEPMLLWDEASRNLTDFNTHFVFVINSINSSAYGDGIAFFLAPEGSKIPDNATKGGNLGLASDGMQLNTTVNRFVAVEFDIYQNYFDPEHDHVGIDVDSMRSVANVTWWSDISGGRTNEAWISYDSRTHNLSVSFTGFRNNTTIMQHLSAIIDLRLYLPEKVTFGFSAATGNASAIHKISSWDFSSSLEIDSNHKRRESRTGLAVGLGIAGASVFGMILVWLAVLYRKKFLKDKYNDDAIDEEIEDEFERGTGPRKFSYKELVHATDDFQDIGKLGQGGFGGWQQCVVHRDIKSSNVLLDSDFNAKLGDFGLARLVDHSKGSQTTVLAGTMGYLAPECHMAGKASKQSDVYSYGVVALELACGRKPIQPRAGEGKVNLVEWVWDLYGRAELLEACDPRLKGEFAEQEIEQLMIVGLWCAHPDENSRPSMQQAIHVLNFEAPLPILPSKMPVPTYCILPLNVPPLNQNSSYSTCSGSTESSQITSSSSSSASASASLLLAPRV